MPAIKFRGVDFIQYDSLLTDEERLVRDTTRQFIEDNLIPIIEECNRAGRFPRELVKPMAELGFLRRVPQGIRLRGHGQRGIWPDDAGTGARRLRRAELRQRAVGTRACIRFTNLAATSRKNTWLPAMQKGEKLGCFGLTEPDFGSNPGGMRTRARKVGNEYVINGEKMWITSGTIADVAIIWAKVENENDRVRGFLVETDRPGFKADDIHGKWSLRASVTSGLSLQDVHVPESNLLPKTGGLEVSADVPESGALRHRLGSDRRGDVVLRLRAAVFPAAQAMARSAHRVAPTRAGQADVDDQRDHEGATARAAGGTFERRRQRSSLSTSRWRSETTYGWPSSAPGCRATFSARTV